MRAQRLPPCRSKAQRRQPSAMPQKIFDRCHYAWCTPPRARLKEKCRARARYYMRRAAPQQRPPPCRHEQKCSKACRGARRHERHFYAIERIIDWLIMIDYEWWYDDILNDCINYRHLFSRIHATAAARVTPLFDGARVTPRVAAMPLSKHGRRFLPMSAPPW